MGYYEGWDNVWCDKGQMLGWLCPRCEKFVPMYQEHSCEAVESEQPIEKSQIRQYKYLKCGKKLRHERPIRMSR